MLADIPAKVAELLATSTRATAAGEHAIALELNAAAAVVDIQQHQQATLGRAEGVVHFARVAGSVLGAAMDAAPRIERVPRNRPGGDVLGGSALRADSSEHHRASERKRRLGEPTYPRPVVLVTPSLVQGQAISENIVRLTAALLGAGHRVHVLIAEEQTVRTPPRSILRHGHVPSSREGADVLARLGAMTRKGAPGADGRLSLAILGTNGSHLDSARDAIAHVRSLVPSACAFFGNASCPIELAMAFARVASVQVALSMGVPLLVDGIDGIIFNNPAKMHRDAPVLRAFAGDAGLHCECVETSGGDAASGVSAVAIERELLGVPQHAIVLVQTSNALAKRMSRGSFARDLARFMAARPNVWWVGVGAWDEASEDARSVMAMLSEAKVNGVSVTSRLRFLGPRDDLRSVVKACDIFLNEYPEGGGNSVIESMGCGVPVVALRAGERHAERIGADLVGDEATGTAPRSLASEIESYWSRCAQWCDDPARRREEGQRQQRRALERLDYRAVMREYVRLIEGMIRA